MQQLDGTSCPSLRSAPGCRFTACPLLYCEPALSDVTQRGCFGKRAVLVACRKGHSLCFPVWHCPLVEKGAAWLCAVLSMQLQLRGTFWGPVMGIRHGGDPGGHRGRHSVAPRVLCCSAVAATWAAAAPRKVRDGFFYYYYFYFSCCLD